MSRYTFKSENFDYSNPFNPNERIASTMTQEFRADDLTTVLENFEMFLRGAGFHFNGQLDIVQDEEFENEQEHDNSVWQATVHSLMNPPKFRANVTGCEVCGLDKRMMERHNCYDDNCPVHAVMKKIAEGC